MIPSPPSSSELRISGFPGGAPLIGKTLPSIRTLAVTFFWSPFVVSADLEVVSAAELKVTFPNVSPTVVDRHVPVESPGGSTVTMAGAVVAVSGSRHSFTDEARPAALTLMEPVTEMRQGRKPAGGDLESRRQK